MYTAIDKSKHLHIDSNGTILDNKLRRIAPEADENGYLFFYMPVADQEPEKRYVHVEVIRHHGDAISRSSSHGEIQPHQVLFADNDKTNTRVSNLKYDPRAMPVGDGPPEDDGPDSPPPPPPPDDGPLKEETKTHIHPLEGPETEGPSDVLPEIEETGVFPIPEQIASMEQGPADFTEIKGIGQKYHNKLHANGITTFQELADANTAEIAKMIGAIAPLAHKFQERARALTGQG